MWQRRRTVILMAAVVVAMWSVALPQHAQAGRIATPGVSANQVIVGTSLPQSGPAAPYAILAGGEQAYFNYVNAHGGVYGRKLKLITLDDGYDPARTLDNVKSLVLSDNVFALMGLFGTDNTLAALPFVQQHNVPLVFPLTGSSRVIEPLRHLVFTYEPSYTVEGKVLTDYAFKKLHAQKLAVLYQDDDFGREGLDAITSQAETDGVQLVGSASYALTDLDMSAQVLSLKQANPDAVILFALPPYVVEFLNAAATAGFHPNLLSSSPAAAPALLQSLGASGNGIYFAAWLPDPNSRAKVVSFYRSVVTKYGTVRPSPVTEAGVAAAEIFVEGLRRAGRNPTREALIKALETMRHWNGGLAQSVNYSRAKHDGPEGAFIARSTKATLIPISGYSYPTYP